MSELTLAQISDCHLFADKNACHHGANVYQHLVAVLRDIKNNPDVDMIVFTGDLTQDHTSASYQNFVDAVAECNICIPVYFLPGNHDDVERLNQHLIAAPFKQQNVIEQNHWQLILLNSKSATPAGFFNQPHFEQLMSKVKLNKPCLVFIHHHAIDVDYFIDRHHLTNAEQFWLSLTQYPNIKGVACGHVHRGLTLLPEQTGMPLPLYTCPATSIQFDPAADTVKPLEQPPAYRLFSLLENDTMITEIKKVELNS